ncbi:hypothetical protein Hdeb2414_s0005g00161241 [Helianthus debilis subsp. tardiflorus]
MNLPPSVPNSSYLANREPEPRTGTRANCDLGVRYAAHEVVRLDRHPIPTEDVLVD